MEIRGKTSERDHHVSGLAQIIWVPLLLTYSTTPWTPSPRADNPRQLQHLDLWYYARFSLSPQLVAHWQDRNLRDILAHSADGVLSPFDSGSFPYRRPRWQICTYITSQTVLQSPERTYNICDHFSCQSENAVYSITCRRCNGVYMEEIGRRLRKRFSCHLSSITTDLLSLSLNTSTRQITLWTTSWSVAWAVYRHYTRALLQLGFLYEVARLSHHTEEGLSLKLSVNQIILLLFLLYQPSATHHMSFCLPLYAFWQHSSWLSPFVWPTYFARLLRSLIFFIVLCST